MHFMLNGPSWRHTRCLWVAVLLAFLGADSGVRAEETPGNTALSGYHNFTAMQAELTQLAESDWADLTSLGQTTQGRDIWLLTISAQPNANKPAILVVGNVEASHVLGSELALRIAKHLVVQGPSDDKLRTLLDKYTLYFIPSPSPDATEKNFNSGLREIDGNAIPTDDDRDFEFGEDAPADLNGDGFITMLRIEDDLGTHKVHPDDPRVMIAVDQKKNERGTHRLIPEAKDLDGDGDLGEDAGDGIDFNKNFTFNYNYFGKAAGPHQVSEAESRAIADFCFSHPNIAVVFSFSNQDNLFHPWKSSSSADSQRIKSSLQGDDVLVNDFLTAKFKEIHGASDAPAATSSPGSFVEWAYYHYGRWSFASRGWWIPAVKEDSPAKPEQDTAADDSSASPESVPAESEKEKEKKSQEKRGQEDLNALRWLASEGIDGFVAWTTIEHPDYPGKKVEVGGFKPFIRTQPPERLIDAVVRPHVDFLVAIAELMPTIEIRDVKSKQLSSGFWELELDLVNAGFIPTMSEMGRVNGECYPIVVELDLPEGATLVDGEKKTLVGRLEGQGGSRKLTWLVRVPGSDDAGATVRVSAVSPATNATHTTIELKPVTPQE